MSARAFDFLANGRRSWAQGHANKNPTITLALFPLDPFGAQLRLTPTEARAMALALEAAATYAENVLDTGLGESAVDAPAVVS